MQKMIVLLACVFISFSSFAKIWRVNNNAGIVADFTDVSTAVASASVVAGDTIHVEPSVTAYSGFSLPKRLVFIGPGYFLNPADGALPANIGLQYSTASAKINSLVINDAGASGSKFFGLNFINGVDIYGKATALNLTFEKNYFSGPVTFRVNGANLNSDAIIIRKNFFDYWAISQSGTATASNLVVENCIFYNQQIGVALPTLSGTSNIVRNNSFYSGNANMNIANAYVANNIFFNTTQNTLTNCTIKNNLFTAAQTLPGTATGNQVSVNMTNVYVGGTTGSVDSRAALKTGSPAIGAGVTIAGYTPDAGAFGGPDPYKLSGIPPVPSIYSLSVPTSIPTGTATMNVTFSSRNNN